MDHGSRELKEAEYVTALAESLAKEYRSGGGDLAALFGAFAGLVATQNREVASSCLEALSSVSSRRA